MSANEERPDALAATQMEATLSHTEGAHSDSSDSSGRVITRGTLVGRYVVLGKIGEGGMGAVYAAYDPELDRKIAVKFLHSAITGRDSTSGEQARLLREAQAMAKLSHPNVAAVYDVGTYRSMVFIAMEFIEGQTLKAWLAKKERAWWEIWTVLEGAGRGLAAAHRANIIHRDFKPENVLVDGNRRARVSDFGLARPTTKPELVDDELSDSDGGLHETLTRTGAVMGTPRYMAPEQHMGGETNERTDQFAFCLVVFEAIYGESAFAGDTLADLRRAVTGGELVQPKNRGDAPAWRHQALERGLSVDPKQRFESIGELLIALDRNPRARRNRWLVATFATVTIIGLAALMWPETSRSPVALCSESAQVMEQTWNDVERKKLRDGFIAAKTSIAEDTTTRVTKTLDTYAMSWTKMHEESCKATNVRGDQSQAMLDLRAECLDQRRVEMATMISTLTDKPNKKTVHRATKAAMNLRPIATCADRTALRTAVPLPHDQAKRARIKQLLALRAKAVALRRIGDNKAWAKTVNTLTSALPSVQYPLLRAQIVRSNAWLAVNRGKYKEGLAGYEQAVQLAAEARDDQLAAKIWLRLAWLVGRVQKPDTGLALLKVAEALMKRAGSSVRLRAELHQNRGELLKIKARYKAARAEYDKAIALLQKQSPDDKIGLSNAHDSLATFLYQLGDMKAAETHALLSLNLAEKVVGRFHPTLVSQLNTLGNQHLRRGNYKKALEHLRRALKLRTKQFGEGDPMLLELKTAIARVVFSSGEYAKARQMYEPLIKQAKTLDLSHPYAASVFKNAAGANEGARARELAELALKANTKRFGKNHPRTAQMMVTIAGVCVESKDWQCAVDNATRGSVILGKTIPKTSLAHMVPLYFLSRALLGQGKAKEAIPVLEKTLAAGVRAKANPGRMANARLQLAKALWRANRANRARAIKTALEARKEFLKIKANTRQGYTRVDAFLKKLGAPVPTKPAK